MKKIVVMIFICLLSAPAMVWLIGWDLDLGMERKGLEPPRLYREAMFENNYYRSFDQYFNDSFSLRNPLIFAKRWLDYHLFRMTDASDVHIGTDGWLYSRRSIEDFRKKACDSRAEVEWLALELHAIDRIIHAAGRRFLFFVIPNKATIYPEFVGFVPQDASCSRSRFDLLLDFFAAHPMKGFVRLDGLLNEEKYSYTLLFDRSSTYWNDAAAMIAAEAIQQILFKGTWQDRRLDYRPMSTADRGDLGDRLLGFQLQSEDQQSGRITLSGQPGLPLGIAYSDEVMQTLLPYALQMFSRLELIRTARLPSKQYGEDLRAFDVILLQKFESALDGLTIGIDTIFSIFEDEARLVEKSSIDLGAVVPVSNIDLRSGFEGLAIKSVGPGSVLVFNSIPASQNDVFRVLKLSIQSPHSDLMTIEYLSGLPHVISKSLKPGMNRVYLPLSFQDLLSLKVQPGKKAGLYRLRSAEILAFSTAVDGKEQYQVKASEMVTDIGPGEESVLLTPASEIVTKKLDSETADNEAAANITAEDSNTRPAVSKDLEEPIPEESQLAVLRSHGDIPVSPAESSRSDFQGDADLHELGEKPDLKIPGTDCEIAVPRDYLAANSVRLSEEAFYPHNEISLRPQVSNEPVTVVKNEPDDLITKSESQGEKKDITKIENRKAAVQVPEIPSITLTDFKEGRIFQRRGHSTDIVVSGKYSGGLEAIEARVIRDDTSTEVVKWTIIDPAPRKGIFVGVLANVPQGGWYRLQVRDSSNHAVSDDGKNKWGIGILVAALGQSNMKEWFYTGTSLRSNSLLRKYTRKGWSEMGNKGNAAIAFGNKIIDKLGIPVGLLDFSKNGSGLRKEADWGTGYWEDTTRGSIYSRFVAGVAETGGALEFVVWVQGEADAARGTVTEEEYRSSLESFVTNQIRADIDNGSAQEYLPFLIVMMVKRPGGKDKPHQAIRNAQKLVAENLAGCYLAATTLDLKNQGRQHLAPHAYTTLGQRVAQTVLHVLNEESYHRGPWISETERIDDRTIDIRITHRGGTDFTPAKGITGWEVIANGAPLPIAQVNRHDPQTIRITLEKPLAGNATIRYLYGAMPDAKRPVSDNSALALPLEEYQSVID